MAIRDEVLVKRSLNGIPYVEETCDECAGTGQSLPNGHVEIFGECEYCAGYGSRCIDIIEPTSPWEAFFEVKRDHHG